jgi:hypothetical protein
MKLAFHASTVPMMFFRNNNTTVLCELISPIQNRVASIEDRMERLEEDSRKLMELYTHNRKASEVLLERLESHNKRLESEKGTGWFWRK